jgi:hypothetical protein
VTSKFDTNLTYEDLQEAYKKLNSFGTVVSSNMGNYQKEIDALKASFGKLSADFLLSGYDSTQIVQASSPYFEVGQYRETPGVLVYGTRMEFKDSFSNSDKEYTVIVSAKPLAGAPLSPAKNAGAMEYTVEGSWGRRGGTLSHQIKPIEGKSSTSNRARAIETARDIERSKTTKGYKVIAHHEQNLTDDTIPDSMDWLDNLSDDAIVDSDAPVTPGQMPVIPDYSCYCNGLVQEASLASWLEPDDAGTEVIPIVANDSPDYGFVRLNEKNRGARWLIAVLTSCVPGYIHVRAVPIGEMMDGPEWGTRKRTTRAYVEELVEDSLVATHLDPSKTGTTAAVGSILKSRGGKVVPRDIDFIIVAEEENSVDLVVIDALRWDGDDLSEVGWDMRRMSIEGTWSKTFNDVSIRGNRCISLAPRILDRLRETYLAEGEDVRFELHHKLSYPTEPSWVMPEL